MKVVVLPTKCKVLKRDHQQSDCPFDLNDDLKVREAMAKGAKAPYCQFCGRGLETRIENESGNKI